MEPEQVTQMLVIDQGKLSQGQVSLCKKRVASQVKLALGQCSFLRVLAGERSTREILSKPVPFSRSRNWRSFIDPASGRAVVQGHVIRSGLSNLGRIFSRPDVCQVRRSVGCSERSESDRFGFGC